MKLRCETCKHFVPCEINPTAAMGTCGHPKRKESVGFFPMELHHCRAHEPTTTEKPA